MSTWEATYGLLVVQVTLLSLMAGIAYLATSRRHPAADTRFLGVTILLILGLTVVAGLPLPGFWSLGVWPREVAVTQSPKPPSPTHETFGQQTETLADLPDLSWTNVAEPERPPAAPIDAASPLASSPATIEIPWTRVLAIFLLAGGTIAGIRLVCGLGSTYRVVAQSREVKDAKLAGIVEAIRCSTGCRRVELRVSSEIGSAATVGWRRPLLIVSEDWQQWSQQELRAALAHEMMHVQSNDYITGLIARITCAFYFFHPPVRWLGARLFLAQEAAADAAAAKFVGGRADYLAALSRIALRQDRHVKSLPMLSFVSSFSTALMRRIEMLETKAGHCSRIMRSIQGTALACLCVGAIGVSALRAPANDGKIESESTVSGAQEESTSSIRDNAGSAEQGVSAQNDTLPPLPRSVVYREIFVRDGMPRLVRQVMQLAPDQYRSEMRGGHLFISNGETSISLNPETKQAHITVYPKKGSESSGFFSFHRKLLTDPQYMPEWKREALGESEIDGRRVVGYQITHYRTIRKLWVDPDSLLPVQIESVDRMYPNAKTIQTDFVCSIALDASLFNVEPPADFTVVRRRVDSVSVAETDLIETFRQFREHQSTFPDRLDGASDDDLYRKQRRALGEKPTPEQYEEYRKWSSKVSRGIAFVGGLSSQADAHYAGKGVSVTPSDTPIFWYRPEGSEKHRVIRADLSVIETEMPPDIPGAQSYSDWGQEERAQRRPWRNIAAAYNVQNLAPLVRKMGILPFSLRNELKIRVIPGSAAENAGLRTGDRIIALSGLKVDRIEHVAALWALLPFYAKLRPSLVDEGVPLTVLRDEGQEVEVILPNQETPGLLSPSGRNAGNEHALLLLARQIGIEPESDELTLNDVVTIRVLPGSAAERAGIRSGDQITALDGEKIVRLKDLIALLAWVPLDEDSQELAPRQGIHLTLLREGETIEATLPSEVLSTLELPPGSDRL